MTTKKKPPPPAPINLHPQILKLLFRIEYKYSIFLFVILFDKFFFINQCFLKILPSSLKLPEEKFFLIG